MLVKVHSLALADGLLREARAHRDHHVVRHAPHEDAAVARRRDEMLAVRREPDNNTHTSSIQGFMAGRSTNSNLLIYTNYICSAFNDKIQVDSIYTDFSKAFDKVDHSILLSKAGQYGIHGSLHHWLSSYLSNRSQLVAIHGVESLPFTPTSGVPQGSNLGPLLFIIFVNDIFRIIRSECLAYADDLKIYLRIDSLCSCEMLQQDLIALNNWCHKNLMDLNIKKCQIITFTKSKRPITYDYKIDGKLLERISVIRDLGVTFDGELSFKAHYDKIISRANQMLGFILRTSKPFRRPETFLILYNALVRSLLEYCSAVWSPHYAVHIERVEGVQARFLRSLCNRLGLRRSLPQYEDRLKRFKLASLQDRRRITDLCILYKIVHGGFGSGLLSEINFKAPLRNNRHLNSFVVPVVNNNVSRNNPIHRMLSFYNSISTDIDIFGSSLNSFRCFLYKH